MTLRDKLWIASAVVLATLLILCYVLQSTTEFYIPLWPGR